MCKMDMKARLTLILMALFWAWIVGVIVVSCTGCASTANKVTASASGKNLNLDGYVMLGELETANPETVTPQGKMIIGRVTYKSRKVGIPADQKVPLSGYYKKTKTKSLFGTEEEILEMDFTAGSESEAEKAMKVLGAASADAGGERIKTDKNGENGARLTAGDGVQNGKEVRK